MDQERSELEKKNLGESEKYDSGEVEETEASDEALEIRSQIEDTRAEMSETINAIEEKFDVGKISEKVKDEVSEHISDAYETVKDNVYDATIGKVGNFMSNISNELGKMSGSFGDAETYVVEGAKQNALPLALIGLGVGLLFFSGRSSSGKNRSKNYYDVKYGGQKDSTLDRAKGAVGGTADSVSDAASSAYQKAGETASNVGEYAQDLSETAYSKYEETLSSNPLVVGAVALGLGAAVALAVPSTDYEDQWMGETKDNLVSSAGDMAQNVVSKAKEAVGDVAQTASKKISS